MFTRTRCLMSAVALATALLLSGPHPAQATNRLADGTWLALRGTINVPIWIPSLPDAVNSGLLGLSRPEVDGFGWVNTTGVDPQTITVPLNFFSDERDQIMGPRKAFGAGSLVQFDTSFTIAGPVAVAVLKAGAKTSRPANFAFCPGATANPECSVPITGGSQGTKLGLVIYTAGGDQFGGTMQRMLGGGSTVSLTIGGSPIRISHREVAVVGVQPAGGAYSTMTQDTLLGGLITDAAQTTSTRGLITAIGPQIDTGETSNLTNTGFPFTTGMITIRLPAQGTGDPFTVVVTGNDGRNAAGEGNITLVSGGLSHRSNGPSFANIDTVEFNIPGTNPGGQMPALSPLGIGAMVMLMVAAGGYILRKRFA